jgi:cysteinyl-tRNA synthetase
VSLKIYNTLSRQKEDFIPLNPPHVSIYVCGPTVYDYLHVGNFRGPVVYNMMRNWLEVKGFTVKFALNFTDVDDKIINRANADQHDPLKLADQFIQEYKKDFADLGLKPHELNPKVSETMDEIIKIIGELIEKKKAYVAGYDVMYSIQSFPQYGKLSGHRVEDLQSGARVEIDQKKENAVDFALWKGVKPGEPSWPSPWGPGRPGWHIECSGMICKHFGEQIDIHGGGTDLIFPHHENEIAQSEGVSGKDFVKYWVHVSMLNFSGQKMSKSVGNIMSMREFLQTYNPEIYKWMILSSHYRSICDFGNDGVHRAVAALARIYSAMAVAEEYLVSGVDGKPDAAFDKLSDDTWKKVVQSLDDDFNTPEAFAALFELVRIFNTQIKRGMKANASLVGKSKTFLELTRRMGRPMALFQLKASEFLTTLDDMLLSKMNLRREEIDKLVSERAAARIAKDFKKSDEVRAQLTALGISVMDTADGSVWEVTK